MAVASSTTRAWRSRGSGPERGYRHLLKRRDLARFVELIPDWETVSEDLRRIVLSADETCMGWYRHGVVAVCAWPANLWCEDMDPSWHEGHADILERLRVDVVKHGPRRVARWTEAQARAFQLLHVFLHELGHHHDCITTASRRDAARGEPYAERFARERAELMWDAYVREFPLD